MLFKATNRTRRGWNPAMLLIAVGLVAWGCGTTETETVYVNAAQGSLSASAEEQNECYEACVADGEEPGECRRACYEASPAGVDACMDGCLARGESPDVCRMVCAEVEEIRDEQEEDSDLVQECIRECMEGEGGGETCREECSDA